MNELIPYASEICGVLLKAASVVALVFLSMALHRWRKTMSESWHYTVTMPGSTTGTTSTTASFGDGQPYATTTGSNATVQITQPKEQSLRTRETPKAAQAVIHTAQPQPEPPSAQRVQHLREQKMQAQPHPAPTEPAPLRPATPFPKPPAPVEIVECGHCHNEIKSKPVTTLIEGGKRTAVYVCDTCGQRVSLEEA